MLARDGEGWEEKMRLNGNGVGDFCFVSILTKFDFKIQPCP